MTQYDPVLFSRILTTTTLAFHAIFATLGFGTPLLIALAEWMGVKRKDEHYHLLARRWTRGYVISVSVGVVTGTAISVQLSLLWPNFMVAGGQTIALPLFMEVFAFFFEAIFLGIYIYTWNRFKNPYYHFLLLLPVFLFSGISAFFIASVNAFMNTPTGFAIKNGILTSTNPLLAMFNPATPTKVTHILVSGYVTTAFILASIAALSILRGRNHVYHKKALKLTMMVALVFALCTALIGDFSGKYLEHYQPEKLAAAEWHFETRKNAPLIFGGFLDNDRKIHGAIEFPNMLSILSEGVPDGEVTGLDQFPEKYWPPLYVHYYFDWMVTIGIFLLVVSLIYIFMQYRKKSNEFNRPLLWAIIIGGPLAMVGIEAGWFMTEQGRQPWIVRGLMTTAQAATKSSYVDIMLYLFILLYLTLAISIIIVLKRVFKGNPAEVELKKRGIE